MIDVASHSPVLRLTFSSVSLRVSPYHTPHQIHTRAHNDTHTHTHHVISKLQHIQINVVYHELGEYSVEAGS